MTYRLGRQKHKTWRNTIWTPLDATEGHFSVLDSVRTPDSTPEAAPRVRGESEPPASMEERHRPKRKISPEGMKRIIAATKKRWRLQRAAAKAVPARKASPRKAGDGKIS